MEQDCFDCGVALKDENRSQDTVDGRPICIDCSEKRWQEFLAV